MTYFKRHNISPSLARKPLITDTVGVNRRIHFSQISHVLNMPIEEIRVLNPQYRHDVIPGDENHNYTLCLPSQQVYSYIMSEDSIAAYRNDLYAHRDVVEPAGVTVNNDNNRNYTWETKTVTQYHKVRRGENASKIAARYGMTTKQLAQLNGLRHGKVQRGQTLKVTTRKRYKVYTNQSADNNEELLAEASTKQPQPDSEEVDDNDNDNDNDEEESESEQIEEVQRVEREAAQAKLAAQTKKAEEKKTTRSTNVVEPASDSKQWHSRNAKYADNRKSGNRETTYKNSRSSKRGGKHVEKEAKPVEHTIKKGESLDKIAKKAGVSVAELKKANGITGSGDKIKVGESLKIPAKGSTATTKAAKAGKRRGTAKPHQAAKNPQRSHPNDANKTRRMPGQNNEAGTEHSRLIVLFSSIRSQGDFTTQVALQIVLHGIGRKAHPEEVHQLGDSSLAGNVVAAYHTGLGQRVTRFVKRVVHTAIHTLRDVENHHTPLHGLADEAHESGVGGGIAGAIGLQHNALDARRGKQVPQGGVGHAGVQFKKHHIQVHNGTNLQGPTRRRAIKRSGVEGDIKPDAGQLGIVVTAEGIEVVGTHLGAAIASPQIVLEQDGHFLHHGLAMRIHGRRHLQGRDQVFLTIGPNLADGQLRPGDNHGLVKILEHKAQCRCRESHRIGAVKHHKTVESVIVLLDSQRYLGPMGGIHVRAVNGRVELKMLDVVGQFLDFGHIVDKMREVERLQRVGDRILNHADGATGVDNQNFGT